MMMLMKRFAMMSMRLGWILLVAASSTAGAFSIPPPCRGGTATSSSSTRTTINAVVRHKHNNCCHFLKSNLGGDAIDNMHRRHHVANQYDGRKITPESILRLQALSTPTLVDEEKDYGGTTPRHVMLEGRSPKAIKLRQKVQEIIHQQRNNNNAASSASCHVVGKVAQGK